MGSKVKIPWAVGEDVVTVLNVGLTEPSIRVIHQSPMMQILSGGKVAQNELVCQCHAEAVHVRRPPDARLKPLSRVTKVLARRKGGPHGMHPISIVMAKESSECVQAVGSGREDSLNGPICYRLCGPLCSLIFGDVCVARYPSDINA